MGYPNTPQPRVRVSPRAKGQQERAEALTSIRNDEAPEKRAVLRGDADTGAVKLLANRITAAPTMEQYNALVEDVRQVCVALNRMGANFVGF